MNKLFFLLAPLCAFAQYTSPSCGPLGGSTAWACRAWPTLTAPVLLPPGTSTADPDTGNRVLRLTGPGSLGEASTVAFKGFDAGWRQAWNATNTRVLIQSWGGSGRAYWLGFDPATMQLTSASGAVPGGMVAEFDPVDPDLLVGLVGSLVKSYNVRTGAWATVFDPAAVKWPGSVWLAAVGGPSVCIAGGGQDVGWREVCYNRATGKDSQIDLRAQTINGLPFPVLMNSAAVKLPASTTHHTITVAPDGEWLAIDTHGNTPCSVAGQANYASTSLFVNLKTKTGYEWNIGCGGTHWAYGHSGIMMQSSSPKWTPTGADSPCASDSRGILRRETNSVVDAAAAQLGGCSFYSGSWNVNVHLSWAPGPDNAAPVLAAFENEGVVPGSFLSGEIAAMQTTALAYQGRLWRFGQTWNDAPATQCGFLAYASPSVSRDGRFILFASDWRGKTGKGVCTNGKRTDVFVMELR